MEERFTMRRLIALMTGVLVTVGMAVAPASPANAGADTASQPGWSVTATVPDLVWTNGLMCQKVPVTIRVEGDVTGWGVYLEAGKSTAKKMSMELWAEGTTAGEFRYQLSRRVCPTLSAMGTYVVAGIAAVEINGTVSDLQVLAMTFGSGSPAPQVKAKAVSGKSKMLVDVNPTARKKAWTFQVQAKQPDGSWITLPKVYRTRASSEKRTVNLPQGTYRALVAPKFGFAQAFSPEVYLAR
jgi:hypothetical protein